MALQLIKIENGNIIVIDNEAEWLSHYHDNRDGSYFSSVLAVTNESDTSKGYENITIKLLVNDTEDVKTISENGIVYQLLPIVGGMLPSPEAIAQIGHNSTITLDPILAGDTGVRYFAVRTFVPRGISARYVTESSLRINAIES